VGGIESYCLSGGRLFRATPTGRACRARSLGAAKTNSPAGSFAELFKKRSGGGGVRDGCEQQKIKKQC